MINNKLLLGTLSVVLITGITVPVFAVDDAGNLESGDEILSETQSGSEERIVLPAQTNVVTNGDFETGNLNGWTTFVTATGEINPTVVLFDTDGDTVATQSARFQVGDLTLPIGTQEGGGIFQNVITPSGTVMIAADIAALPTQFTNSECGIFTLFFDNVVVDSHQFGGGVPNCAVGVTVRSQLMAEVNGVSAGSHEVKIQMTRPFTTGTGTGNTPFQFIDNVQVLVEDEVVGGEFLPIDSTALMLAGLQSSAIWMLPVLAGVAGSAFGILYIKSRRN